MRLKLPAVIVVGKEQKNKKAIPMKKVDNPILHLRITRDSP